MLAKFFLGVALISGVGCSPGYIFRVSWEEAGILLRRKKLEKLLNDESLDPELRRKFALVIEARAFGIGLGLVPKGSYETYSKVDRDVLVWVLSASPKTSLEPYTWWYPIVGSMPYKGFFDKEDALKEAQRLESKGFDTFVRPSIAYSTLGWFNDPLLSTVVRHDEVALVDTVLHEILHNTVWINNYVDFNETLANFVGSKASIEFFRARGESGKAAADLAEGRWHDEMMFARFLNDTAARLEAVYNDKQAAKEVTLERRDAIIKDARDGWIKNKGSLHRPDSYKVQVESLNNASIIAWRLYLTKPELFQRLFDKEGESLKAFIGAIKELSEKMNQSNSEPYSVLQEAVGQVDGTSSNVAPAGAPAGRVVRHENLT